MTSREERSTPARSAPAKGRVKERREARPDEHLQQPAGVRGDEPHAEAAGERENVDQDLVALHPLPTS
jgi:hypothetical protein